MTGTSLAIDWANGVLRLTWEDVFVQGEECEVQGYVGNGGIWLEDGQKTQQACYDEQRLLPKSNGQPTNVADKMQPKNAKKEFAEGVENFDEEVPPEANVW